jgi:hypothetical protein
MDDLCVGTDAPMRLRRACERNRFEQQFLIAAYEHLVILVAPETYRGVRDGGIATAEDRCKEQAHASETCGVGSARAVIITPEQAGKKGGTRGTRAAGPANGWIFVPNQ